MKKLTAIITVFVMMFASFSTLLGNVVYADGEETVVIYFENALPGNDNYNGEENYSTIHWEFVDHEENPIFLFGRVEENVGGNWQPAEVFSMGENLQKAVLTVEEGKTVNEKYRITFDTITDNYNILVNGNRLEENTGFTVTENQTIVNSIQNDMRVRLERRIMKDIEFVNGGTLENSKVKYELSSQSVTIELGTKDVNTFTPVNIINSGDSNGPIRHIIEGGYQGYCLRVSSTESKDQNGNYPFELMINDRMENVRLDENGIVDLSAFDDSGSISVYIAEQGGPVDPGNSEHKTVQFSSCHLDQDGKTAIFDIDNERTIRLQFGKRVLENEELVFEPIALSNSEGCVLGEVEDESLQFDGYFVKVENPDNVDFYLWVDGHTVDLADGKWCDLSGTNRDRLIIEVEAGDHHHQEGNMDATFIVRGGEGYYLNRYFDENNVEIIENVPYSESYVDAAFSMNYGDVITLEQKDEVRDNEGNLLYSEKNIKYNGDENDEKVTISFKSLRNKKYTKKITINEVAYNVSEYIDYEDVDNVMDHYNGVEISFDVEVPKAQDNIYDITIYLEDMGGDINFDEQEITKKVSEDIVDEVLDSIELDETDGLDEMASKILAELKKENSKIKLNIEGETDDEKLENIKLLIKGLNDDFSDFRVIVELVVSENEIVLDDALNAIFGASNVSNGHTKAFYDAVLVLRVKEKRQGEDDVIYKIGTKTNIKDDIEVRFNISNEIKERFTGKVQFGLERKFYVYSLYDGEITRIPMELDDMHNQVTFMTNKFSVFGIGYEDEGSPLYIVKFDTNGGSRIDDVPVEPGQTVGRPENPTKSGYVFDGWYKDENRTEVYDFSTPLTEDIIVYAKWSQIKALSKVDSIKDQTYTGKALSPAVKVKDGSKVLVKNVDYTVKYSSNTNIGTATVTITGKNRYKGTLKKTFKIVPKGTSISKLIAGSKRFTAKWKKQTTKTTGYQIRYSLKSSMGSSKTVTISSNKTLTKLIKKLKGKKKYYVQVRTYKTVNKVKYCSSWSSKKSVTTQK